MAKRTASHPVEVQLRTPSQNKQATLGVFEALSVTSTEIRTPQGDLLANLNQKAGAWTLDESIAAQSGCDAGPWTQLLVVSRMGFPVFRIDGLPIR